MPEPRAQTIAVLGGGISGLTAAFTLSRRLPRDQYRIIVAEASSRLGGHVQSERISVLGEDGPRALYEWGLEVFDLLDTKVVVQSSLYVRMTNVASSTLFNRPDGVSATNVCVCSKPFRIP